MGLRGTSVDATATVPAVADSETTASSNVSTILTELVSRSEAKVTSAEINVDAALDVNSQTLENVSNMELVPAAAPASTANRIYIDSGDSEWYINGVQLTKTGGTALNVTTASGAIGGDYGSGDETFNYNSAAVSYEALSDDSPSKTYAKVDAGDVRLFEHNSAVTTAVSLKSPASLAGSYTLTMPTALSGISPAAGTEAFVTVDSSGNLAHGGTADTTGAFSAGGTSSTLDFLNANDVVRAFTPGVTINAVAAGITASKCYIVHLGNSVYAFSMQIHFTDNTALSGVALKVTGLPAGDLAGAPNDKLYFTTGSLNFADNASAGAMAMMSSGSGDLDIVTTNIASTNSWDFTGGGTDYEIHINGIYAREE